MRYRYYTVDVFTGQRFGGNQLAVLPNAVGLTSEQMQHIAAEFNYAETTFVLPPEVSGHTRRVRIFTPAREMPFAGHPNVGTAYVLAAIGEVVAESPVVTVHFEEIAGTVPVTISFDEGKPVSCELAAPQTLAFQAEFDPRASARALSLTRSDVVLESHVPVAATVGVPFIFVEVKGRDALARAAVDGPAFLAAFASIGAVHLYTHTDAADDVDVRTRMFAPGAGVAEDAATGSANCTLAGMLAHFDARADGRFEYRIAQGVEMGRPSLLLASAEKRGGVVTETRVGGGCVPVMEGHIEV